MRTKLYLAAALALALAACAKSNSDPATTTSEMAVSEGVENSAGSYPPASEATEGTETTGVGTTGVDPATIAEPPTPDTVAK